MNITYSTSGKPQPLFSEEDNIAGNRYLLERGVNPFPRLTQDEAIELQGYFENSQLTPDDWIRRLSLEHKAVKSAEGESVTV